MRLRLTRLWVVLGLLVLVLGLAACGDDDDDDGGGGGGGGDEAADSGGGSGSLQGDGKDLVMFTMTASNVYGANQISGAKQEAEELGYKLTVFQNNFSQPEQDQQVQQYIASGRQAGRDHLLAVGRRRGDQRRAPARRSSRRSSS